MKFILLLCISIVCLGSCKNHAGRDINHKNIITVQDDDLKMNVAIKHAKETFTQFDSAFKNGHFDTSKFSIKVKIETITGSEHIWTQFLTFENGFYYGAIDEDAVATEKVMERDKVKIDMNNLSDWMYSDNGVLRGGFTIKAARDKMNVEARTAFDSTFLLKIID
jgi:uncharacterized protein YegJ (DUF2314 family)